MAPGDLQATGQVAVATAFIANPTPLLFERDLTGQLPATPTTAQPRLTEVDYTLPGHPVPNPWQPTGRGRIELHGALIAAQRLVNEFC